MSDLYSELLVKKEQTAKDKLIKYGLYAIIAILAIGGVLLNPLLIFIGLLVGIGAYFILPSTDVEFEYLFVSGEIDVDRVLAKTKRKKAGSFSVRECELIAPLHSHRLDYYNANSKIKVVDYSSGNDEHKRYAAITRMNNETCKVIFEPDEAMIKTIHQYAPSKVFFE
ncbi:MAG: hypothetical protein KBT01_01040 [Clostridiales bacterium]|nr:hypothetical protein [Candidatus Blautia equi]